MIVNGIKLEFFSISVFQCVSVIIIFAIVARKR